MNPKIAVITAAYNVSNLIKDAIVSVRDQDYEGEIHHYIIDDASTDDTVKTIVDLMYDVEETLAFDYKKYCGRIEDVPTTLIALRKNGRQGRARNFGVRAAWDWADAFVILDADDIKHEDCIRRHVEEWQKDPESIGVVYSDYMIQDSHNRIREFKRSYNRDRLMQECIVSSGALISKEAMKFAGLYMEDTFCVEDYGQWLKISNKYIMVHIPEALWTYRVTGSNSTNESNMDKIREGHQKMATNYQNWLKNPIGYNG